MNTVRSLYLKPVSETRQSLSAKIDDCVLIRALNSVCCIVYSCYVVIEYHRACNITTNNTLLCQMELIAFADCLTARLNLNVLCFD